MQNQTLKLLHIAKIHDIAMLQGECSSLGVLILLNLIGAFLSRKFLNLNKIPISNAVASRLRENQS
jgi:hypothetical protein